MTFVLPHFVIPAPLCNPFAPLCNLCSKNRNNLTRERIFVIFAKVFLLKICEFPHSRNFFSPNFANHKKKGKKNH